MRVSSTQKAFDFTVGALFLALVFVVVLVLQGAVTGGLRSAGMKGGAAALASGAIVFGTVVGGFALVTGYVALMRARAEMERARMRLPDGPCCVLWSEDDSQGAGAAGAPSFAPQRPLQVRFPALARRFGIEGVAVAEFEIAADGRARDIRCIDAWPSTVFFTAAKAALQRARFAGPVSAAGPVSSTGPVRLRMPFVFRIRSARNASRATPSR